jgi:hypothetical protein
VRLFRLTKHPVLLAGAVDRATKKPLGEPGGRKVGSCA